MPLQRRNSELVSLLSADLQRRYEPNFAWKSAVSSILVMPAIRCCYPMSSLTSGAIMPDLCGTGRNLTRNGSLLLSRSDLAPCAVFDGVGDYLSHADHADFDILGTEGYIDGAIRGLTVGGWFYNDNAPAAFEAFVSKADGTVNSSYLLYRLNTGIYRFLIGTGGATVVADTTAAPAAATWHCVIGRFDP
ncbi:MAG: hypothetical protein ABIG63_15070, partial [Chloroflexota bacterium]